MNSNSRGSGNSDLLMSAAMLLVLASLTHFGVSTERNRLEQNLRTEVSHKTLSLVSRLEGELNANVFLANGMVAHVMAQDGESGDEAIHRALMTLYQYGRHIRNLGIAPNNRVSQIYPLEGNETVIGLYYPDIPQQWNAVKKAIESRITILAGPIPLRQGGRGLISRTPVFHPDGRYWGMISIVLDAESLFAAVGLAQEVDGVHYALRGVDGAGGQGDVFFGDAELFIGDALTYDLRIPGGVWRLAATPSNGWRIKAGYLTLLETAGIAGSLLLASILYSYLIGRRRIVDSERRLRAFMDTTRDGVIVIDDHGIVDEFNPAAESLFGYTADEMLGASVNKLMPAADAAIHDGRVANPQSSATRNMSSGRQVNGRHKDGGEFPIEVTVGEAIIRGRRVHVGVVRNITERKAFEQKLIELATTDGLTGVLNRRAFLETAETAFALAKRHGRPLSLLMLDADHFKRINDSFGHHIGDAVLIHLAKRVRGCLRTTDSFGRFGGEEFICLLPETDADHAVEVAERLLATIRAAEIIADNGEKVRYTVSIGVAALSDGISDIGGLIRAADHAMYRAKTSGRDRCCR